MAMTTGGPCGKLFLMISALKKFQTLATPLPLFLICVFLLAVSGFFAFTAAKGLLTGAVTPTPSGGQLQIRIGTVAMNLVIMAGALFLLLGKRWAWLLMLVVLGLCVLNNVAALFMGGELFGNAVAALFVAALWAYLFFSRAVKEKLGQVDSGL